MEHGITSIDMRSTTQLHTTILQLEEIIATPWSYAIRPNLLRWCNPNGDYLHIMANVQARST